MSEKQQASHTMPIGVGCGSCQQLQSELYAAQRDADRLRGVLDRLVAACRGRYAMHYLEFDKRIEEAAREIEA